MTPDSLLTTGFEPFDGRSVNASWIMAQAVAMEINTYPASSLLLPVCWDQPRTLLQTQLDQGTTHVLSFGEGRSGWIDIETIGRNRRQQRLDNNGDLPSDPDCFNGEEDTYRLQVNAVSWQKQLGITGLPVRRSQNAGGFLCDETLYTLMRFSQQGHLQAGAFIHLPPFGSHIHYQHRSQVFDESLITDIAPLFAKAFIDNLVAA